MKLIHHYFPFFILTALLYGVFLHFHKQSTIIPPLPLNSGQQAVQLQFIEITQKRPQKTAASEPEKEETKAIKEKPATAEKKKTTKQTTASTNSKIKIAREKLRKSIQETSAKNDAQLKAELFAADYKQDQLTPAAAAITAAKEPTIQRKPVKTMHPIKEPENREVSQQQERTKPVFKKQPATNSSSVETQGVLQEAIVVSGNIPIYPKRAILRNQQGRVVVKLTVTTKGKGKNPKVITSSGYSILDNAVLNFIRKELFMPALQGENKITSEQIFSFRFELK